MKIALVHDYLNEFGGAEVVLKALTEMFPEAPIYTAFKVEGSTAAKAFENNKIITSWMQYVPGFKKLYSPLRFLIPLIWRSFDLSEYDLIISSASWYVTKGFVKRKGQYEICYCHTPPRWLYGYNTSVNFQKYLLVRIYALIVGHFLRMYDFRQAQKVSQFVANSQEVARRIYKFYRREAVVVCPPVRLPPLAGPSVKKNYYLIVSRLVGGKGIELAIETAQKAGFELKIAGEFAGFKVIPGVETLGRVTDEEKTRLMSEARGFLALSRDEDFGITPVEAMMCGTPVIAFNGGGYKETVVNNKTGILFDDYSVSGLTEAISKCEKTKWNPASIKKQGQLFSIERFEKGMWSVINKYAGTT